MIACFAQSKKEFASDRQSSKEPGCKKYYQPGQAPDYLDKPVYLGVVEYQARSAGPTLVASYGKPYDIKTSWKFSGIEGPEGKFTTPGSQDSDLMPEEYRRFDFAPYQITPMETAIGLRLGWHDAYAGGAAYFEALSLFRLDGGKLVNILSEPISFHKDLAGEWNKDGTRERDVSEEQNVLSVLPSKTNGYADL
ncbi:hypothetical protein F2P44_16455 [Massilia sp. CCM 8695]|uniref:DUF1329 domain-containing protein n=1 Tax=Massilia frigida TaxID=2609281 RepID=A0ABX0N6B3_9BURK|nr:hypothetical protein [Massilia frigida]NHZ80853.1 hypothetical protein [Massilia frigida]